MQTKYNMKFKIPGKLNIDFHVKKKVGERHVVDTLTQSIDIYDEVEYVSSLNNLTIKVISDDECFVESIFLEYIENKITKLKKFFGELKGRIQITKNIPFGYGLGGSSAVLVGLIKIFESVYNRKLTNNEVLTISSDAVVMYNQGRYKVSGFGDIIERQENVEKKYVLIFPKQRSTTENIYDEFDKLQSKVKSCNDFLTIVCNKNSEVRDIIALARQNNIEVRMTGSGSCMYTIYNEEIIKIFAKYKLKIVTALGG